jgi:hypothetical protein
MKFGVKIKTNIEHAHLIRSIGCWPDFTEGAPIREVVPTSEIWRTDSKRNCCWKVRLLSSSVGGKEKCDD